MSVMFVAGIMSGTVQRVSGCLITRREKRQHNGRKSGNERSSGKNAKRV